MEDVDWKTIALKAFKAYDDCDSPWHYMSNDESRAIDQALKQLEEES